MAVDLLVYVDHGPHMTVLEWQRAIDRSHLPLRLDKHIDLDKASGFFPVVLRNKKTGFFLVHTDVKDASGLARVKVSAGYDFSFGGHFLEAASAYYVASALVARFNGRALDPQTGAWLNAQQLQEAAVAFEAEGTAEKGIGE
jgi:hypothetical protein